MRARGRLPFREGACGFAMAAASCRRWAGMPVVCLLALMGCGFSAGATKAGRTRCPSCDDRKGWVQWGLRMFRDAGLGAGMYPHHSVQPFADPCC